MNEPVLGWKGSRSRRTIATLTWAGLTVVAGLMWYGRLYGTMRGAATEPIALLLSAYASFSSIFAWMLFAPNRRSAEESPALFLGGGITLLPPCIISFCIMPPDSPLRGWLTLGVFVLIVIAVMSPVPEEFFAVPRDRSTYLQPISDAMFSRLNVADLPSGFSALQANEFPAQRTSVNYAPVKDPVEWRGEARDPWQDPFRGTGIQPVRPGSAKPLRSHSSNRIVDRPAPPRDVAAVPAKSDTRPALATEVAKTASRPSVMPQRPAAAFGFRTPLADASIPEVDTPSGSTVANDETGLNYERTRDEFGGQMIEGTSRIVFAEGQKRANLHIPFSPPLPGIPNVECEAVGNESLRLKVPVRQSYGIRIEARRSDASHPLETEIGFAAIYTPESRAS